MSLTGNAILLDDEVQGRVEPIQEVRGKMTGLEFIEGRSAYEVAVLHGFEGTEEEWLESLRGAPGPKGEDGSISLEELTEEQREQLRGPQGSPGQDGKDGSNGIGIKSITIQEVL